MSVYSELYCNSKRFLYTMYIDRDYALTDTTTVNMVIYNIYTL